MFCNTSGPIYPPFVQKRRPKQVKYLTGVPWKASSEVWPAPRLSGPNCPEPAYMIHCHVSKGVQTSVKLELIRNFNQLHFSPCTCVKNERGKSNKNKQQSFRLQALSYTKNITHWSENSTSCIYRAM